MSLRSKEKMKHTFLIFILFLVASCTNNENHDKEAVAVGDYLLMSSLSGELFNGSTTEHVNIVRVGEDLKVKLSGLISTLSRECHSTLDSEFSDPEASHVVIINCAAGPILGVRLKWDDVYKSFHILGWWTSGL